MPSASRATDVAQTRPAGFAPLLGHPDRRRPSWPAFWRRSGCRPHSDPMGAAGGQRVGSSTSLPRVPTANAI
eukprot:9886605-Alexandrium_andersonii.AAC.1